MDLKKLVEILKELSYSSKTINTENELHAVMSKYDMLFLGENFNCINTIELRHSLDKIFDISVTLEELNSLVPDACTILNMKYEQMVSIDNHSSTHACYQIYL